MGSPIQVHETTNFAEFIQVTNLMELKVVGREFTWTNKHAFGRIDRGLVNPIWVQTVQLWKW